MDITERLEYLRGELRAERISWGELAELQSLAGHIAPDDVELLEAAGEPEHGESRDQKLADEISAAEDQIGSLAGQLGGLVEHATSRNATAHAALYEHVQGCITAAEKQLRRAHEIMLNGDPTDYDN